ncbi:imidazolonepropionase [bacterium]|nr:imidazolonepropionase [bacterium]
MRKAVAKTLITHIAELVTMRGAWQKNARGPQTEKDLAVAKKQAIVIENDQIIWIGSQNKIPRLYRSIKNQKAIHANVYPGFIDCHTHSIFAGDRTHEFEMRIQGATYQNIAQNGGGIMHTVRETRKASSTKLKNDLQKRLLNFLAQGVTTVEVKSGYGLTVKDELRLLEVIQKQNTPVQTVSTFLGAHAIPPEKSSAADYLKDLKSAMDQILQKKLAKRIDIFIEKNYFPLHEAKDFLNEAKAKGFDIAIHADQISRTGAASLAVDLGSKSADHVICVDKKDIHKLAKSEVTSVFLPTADFYLRCPYPPARELIDRGARFALATDFNPGTSPTQNIQWVGLLARQEMKMTLPEVFSALTVGGAYALGLEKSHGVIAEGFNADFFVSPMDWDQFFYSLGPIPIESVWIRGQSFKV